MNIFKSRDDCSCSLFDMRLKSDRKKFFLLRNLCGMFAIDYILFFRTDYKNIKALCGEIILKNLVIFFFFLRDE
jgi:hypothetical protein